MAPAFFPAVYWGGPTVSVYQLCNHLVQLPGVRLRALTTDTSGPRSQDRLSEGQRRSDQFPGYEVVFCRKLGGVDFTPSLWLRVWSLVAWAHVVHLTAVYSSTTFPTLLAARLLGKPVVWSPRGALQRWAGSRRSALKWLWERACSLLLSRDRTLLHVTSEEEGSESATRLRGIRILQIPNGVESPDTIPERAWAPGGCLRLLYLGRLDEKKGIENLLHAVAALPKGHAVLRICGVGEFRYTASLRALVATLGLEGRVEFAGAVEGTAKAEALIGSDVCIVPSYTENFGIVVTESLAHGTPVIASRGTPWRELERVRAGSWVQNDPPSLATAIQTLRGADLREMGLRGRQWMIAEFSWQSVAHRMLDAYRTLER